MCVADACGQLAVIASKDVFDTARSPNGDIVRALGQQPLDGPRVLRLAESRAHSVIRITPDITLVARPSNAPRWLHARTKELAGDGAPDPVLGTPTMLLAKS
jgi:hypothetical protein